MRKTKEILQILDAIKLDLADTCDLPGDFVSEIICKRTRNIVTEDELILARKHPAQRFFGDPLTGVQVVEFERNQKAITNPILMARMDPLFMLKLYLNEGGRARPGSAEGGPDVVWRRGL